MSDFGLDLEVVDPVPLPEWCRRMRRLAAQVLLSALRDASAPAGARRAGVRTTHWERDSAREWIFSDDDSFQWSFLNVCAVLGIDYRRIRRRMVAEPEAMRAHLMRGGSLATHRKAAEVRAS